MPAHSEAVISVRAYQIWEQQGRPHGRDREHWLQAVTELEAIAAKRKPKLAPKTKAAVAPPKRTRSKAT